jgi:hypothetical protein
MRDLEAQLRMYGAVLNAAEPAMTDVADASLRPARRSLLVMVAAVVVVAIAASAIAITATRSGDARRPNVVTPVPTVPVSPATGVLAIGDQVMRGATGALAAQIPGIMVDARVSHQFSQAISALRAHESGATFGSVVVALGTNGLLTPDDADAFIRAAAPREIYFVTDRVPRPWETPNNSLLRALPGHWERAHVIDWHDFANAHDDWFVEDGFHLTAAGQRAYATLIATTLGVAPTPTSTSAPAVADSIKVIDAFAGTDRLYPLAVAGGDVWVASEGHTDSTTFVHLERRDPSTAKVLGAIDVPQEAVIGIAGAGDTIWVVGGGDGGVPDTTVSRVDVRTNRVVFTKTLTGTPCACPIVAGDAGVWIVGNSSDYALQVSETDGHVIATVNLPARALFNASMEVRSRLAVGLGDGTVAVIDPSTHRIESMIPRPVVGDEGAEAVHAMAPASIPAVGSDPPFDGLIARANGGLDVLRSSTWQVSEVGSTVFGPSTVVARGSFGWMFGGDQLEVSTTHAASSSEFTYDAVEHRFTRSPGGSPNAAQGFRDAVIVGDRIWVVYDSGPGDDQQPTVVVMRAPDGLP